MTKQILQLENVNASDFRSEIVKDVTKALLSYSESQNNPDNEIILTRQETAALLSVSLVTLWDWTNKNILKAYRIGTKVRYKKNEVLLALKQMNKFD